MVFAVIWDFTKLWGVHTKNIFYLSNFAFLEDSLLLLQYPLSKSFFF